jgi:HD superfamily phosphohydrolase
MSNLFEIPEIVALEGSGGLIRIPNQIDVPVTPRILRLIDTPEFQRLKKISQLGLVAFVYPGATHNRFEHSLGVYRMALMFLKQLGHQARFAEAVSNRAATVLIVAALLHDIGHWPFCHPIEDLSLEQMPSHEQFAEAYLNSNSIRRLLDQDWNIDPQDVIDLINKRSRLPGGSILSSILSSPIDIDKMDYLYRDSLHAGVPYGQNFDAPRLIRSLCLNQAGDRLAITHKGKTAAELMVFARYVMFSEVYWHHAVRSATSMFQRSFFRWYQANQVSPEFNLLVESLFKCSESAIIQHLLESNLPSVKTLVQSLFGESRLIYKRLAAYSCMEGESIYRRIARRPYPWLVELSERFAEQLSQSIGQPIEPDHVLIDSPPVGLEVQFDVEVHFPNDNRYAALDSVSPVVQTLAKRQFDDYVKQVRIFFHPDLIFELNKLDDTQDRVSEILLDLTG